MEGKSWKNSLGADPKDFVELQAGCCVLGLCGCSLLNLFLFFFSPLKIGLFLNKKCCFEMKRQNIPGHNKTFQRF